MEVKKIQKTVSGSYILTLPKEWAERNIHRGEGKVAIREAGEELRLLPGEGSAPAPAGCTLVLKESSGRILAERVQSCYEMGCDEMRVKIGKATPETRQALQRVLADLTGVAVLNEQKDTVILKCLVDSRGLPFDSGAGRMMDLAGEMLSGLATALNENNPAAGMEVAGREGDSVKLYKLMLRTLILQESHGSETPRMAFAYVLTVQELMTLVRGLSRLASTVARSAGNGLATEERRSELLKGLAVAGALLEDVRKALLAGDLSRADAVLAAKKEGFPAEVAPILAALEGLAERAFLLAAARNETH